MALCFLLKFLNRSRYFAPKFIESHYGTSAKRTLRELEKISRKIVRRTTDSEFLKLCLSYRLYPTFTKFKLHKQKRLCLPEVRCLKRKLITAEIRSHSKELIQLHKEALRLKKNLSTYIGQISMIYSNRFFNNIRKEERD